MTSLQPVILCGGSGTRLWPVSRKDHPKPFLPLLGATSLFEQTVARVTGIDGAARPIVVAGNAHADLVRAQAPDAELIVEPAARNTAPAIALAAHRTPRDALLLVCPSDHHIADVEAFAAAVSRAVPLAEAGRMVSIGVAPTRAETGYGYIELGDPIGEGHVTARFVEKPDRARAEQFLTSGRFVWNAGIFVLQAGAFLDELARHRPEMAAQIAASVEAAAVADRVVRPGAESFGAIVGDSIDYAVMEATDRAAVVVADMGWTDIGDWHALADARAGEADADGNMVRGNADLVGARGCLVQSDGPRVSVIGLEDVVVVVHDGEVMVTSRNAAQSVGKLPGAINQ